MVQVITKAVKLVMNNGYKALSSKPRQNSKAKCNIKTTPCAKIYDYLETYNNCTIIIFPKEHSGSSINICWFIIRTFLIYLCTFTEESHLGRSIY